ncbi:unnamed protein product [Paramecium pentaurelia]|uniref:Uncharacterized protein n=1 Tax=Paramecium pentaurelia TaxID=43138 RepID=A0A8S1T948_9CILI|nr:unnamed protein product [Paramecium pentaurelia]
MYQDSRQRDYSNHSSQVEHQKFKTSQINSEEQVVKFTVRQDFLNVIGIAADFQAAIESQIKEQNFDQIMAMLHNKLILQVNLSSSIHYDQQYECQKSHHLKEILYQEKLKAKQFLKSILDQQKFDPKIEQHLRIYLNNCLGDRPQMLQEPLNSIKYKTEFNQDTVQKILGSMNSTDQKYRDLQSGKTQAEELSISQIDQYIKKRKDATQKKLKNESDRECKCSVM